MAKDRTAVSDRRLTHQERVFAQHMASTNDRTYAAKMAGYPTPRARAHEALKRPAVNAEIAALCQAELHNDLRPLANLRLRKILENEDLAPRDHIAAAKVVIAECGRTADPGGKDLHAMAPDELHAMLARIERQMEREAAETLEPIEPAAPPPTPEGSVFD